MHCFFLLEEAAKAKKSKEAKAKAAAEEAERLGKYIMSRTLNKPELIFGAQHLKKYNLYIYSPFCWSLFFSLHMWRFWKNLRSQFLWFAKKILSPHSSHHNSLSSLNIC